MSPQPERRADARPRRVLDVFLGAWIILLMSGLMAFSVLSGEAEVAHLALEFLGVLTGAVICVEDRMLPFVRMVLDALPWTHDARTTGRRGHD